MLPMRKRESMIKKTFCVALIACGFALDTYFYAFRFTADGLPLSVAVVSGIALELLLSFAVYNARASKLFAAIAIIITCYAVVQTAAGQTFALLTHTVSAGTDTRESTASFTIAECKKNIARLSTESDTINAQLRSLQSAEARSLYAVTIYNATRRLETLSAERARTTDTLLRLSSDVVTDAKTGEERKSIYNFYSSLPNWNGGDWLKFIFHFFLSVLIAIMAPVGIISWGTNAAPVAAFTRQQIEMFVAAAWYKIRNNTGAYVLSEVAFNELLQRRGHPVEAGMYFALSNRCVNAGLINTSGLALEKDHQKVIKKLTGEKENIFRSVQKWVKTAREFVFNLRQDLET